MAIYIEMPKLSDTMTEGTLLKWRKNEGDKVETGDVLAEVETDKATMEMEAFDDGILHKHLVAAGAKARSAPRSRCSCKKAKPRPPKVRRSPTVAEDRCGQSRHDRRRPPSRPKASAAKPAHRVLRHRGARVKASPLAKKIAAGKGR